MAGRYVLDTNIVIALIRGELPVRERIAAADEVFIPAPVLGELYFGALKSGQPAQNVERIDNLAHECATPSVDAATAKIYGSLRNALRAKGMPIPENDIWIAAVAQQSASTIATRDEHFHAFSNVFIEMW
jgi:tRNA(fMet)-specific endonuclease VapC